MVREKKFKKSLFIFHRDLRLQDNTGLIEALKLSEYVIPCFIFDPAQIKNNEYRSDNCIQFMLSSLNSLNASLKKKGSHLYIFSGKTVDVVDKILSLEDIHAVFSNRDYTPFSQHRDEAIKHACQKRGVIFSLFSDALLNEPEDIYKNDGGAYTVFSAFKRKAVEKDVKSPVKNTFTNYYSGKVKLEDKGAINKIQITRNDNLYIKGGREEGSKLLRNIERLKNYDNDRNIPHLDLTTGLSAHHKFGTVSIRETYKRVKSLFGEGHTLISELYWRDFFTHIGFHYPHVLGSCFHEKYNSISWSEDKKSFKRWCDGQTGFPIVDAGMRELNVTGYMHNRVRMITASFLVKDLHINWQWGEKYFARTLLDYDPLVNNGNWQWAASTGCDAQPYFRIFNPWRQQKRFDPDCLYIKKWIPELKDAPPKDIHALAESASLLAPHYPSPMVAHSVQVKKTLQLFKSA